MEWDNKSKLELPLFHIKACPGWVRPPDEVLWVAPGSSSRSALSASGVLPDTHRVTLFSLIPRGNPQ